MKEAMLYKKRDSGTVDCVLCAQYCHIEPGARGKCGVRENRNGTLYSLVYEALIAQSIDPIEKKPLYHFHPGSRSFSIATAGCNFRCTFCQNADISQAPLDRGAIPGQKVPAPWIVERAREAGCATIAYTYTEPTIFMEYALAVAEPAHEDGIGNVFVSNGFMTEASFEAIHPFLDAANVDLKAFRDHYYVEQCGARLKPVLQTLERMKRGGVWLEVTTLLIPGLNDDPGELRELADFLVGLGPDTPWHVSRFYPTYRLTDRPPTPVATVRKAREIGLEAGLRYVYTGNIPGDDGANTLCHQCRAVLIERNGYAIQRRDLSAGQCIRCGTPLAGVGLG